MKITVRVFMYNAEDMKYDDHVTAQWVIPSGSPTPHIGEIIYMDDNFDTMAEVKELMYCYPNDGFDHIMIDCMAKAVG